MARDEFQGLTDKYLSLFKVGDFQLAETFVLSSYLAKHELETFQNRYARYRRNWNFYKGSHWNEPVTDGVRKPVHNFCRMMVDKGVRFLFGKPWSVTAPKHLQHLVPDMEDVWRQNSKHTLSVKMGQMGGVTGDTFLYITTQTMDKNGQEIPRAEQPIKIVHMDSDYSFPIFEPSSGQMIACYFQMPAIIQGDYGKPVFGIRTLYISDSEIREWVNDTELPKKRNEFGFLNVVHGHNLLSSEGFLGQADLDDITYINEDYNTAVWNIKEILDYHGAPLTVCEGVSPHKIIKGPNRTIGVPKGAKVYNLEISSDLGAAVKYTEILERNLGRFSNIPPAAYGDQLAISNTSGTALETTFMPLLEATEMKRLTYGTLFSDVMDMIVRIRRDYRGETIEGIEPDEDKFGFGAKFGHPLPQDRNVEMEMIERELKAGLESQFGALLRRGVEDPTGKALEIVADKMETMLREVLAARATANPGIEPNIALYGMGSLSLRAGLGDLIRQLSQISATSGPPPVPPTLEPEASTPNGDKKKVSSKETTP